DRKNLDKKPPGVPGATGNTRGPINRPGPRSRDLEVLGGGLAAVGDEFVLDHLSLVEGAQSGAFDRGNVDEHVLVPCRRPAEAVALSRIEPFDGALLHRLSPSQSERKMRRGRTKCLPCQQAGGLWGSETVAHNAQGRSGQKFRLLRP